MTDLEPTVLFERRGALGLVTLNRPRAINALTLEMIRALQAQLDEWEHDDNVRTVAIRGAGERGLCAGGDVAVLARAFLDGDRDAAMAASREFFRAEYRLNRSIARYPKPYVALMDGIVLGGGVGVSAHGSHRVVTERSKIGMPETAIGLFPDIGATWLLANAPGGLGERMALTGVPVDAATALAAGFADAYVDSQHLDALLDQLASANVDAAIASFALREPATDRQVEHVLESATSGWMGSLREASSLDDVLVSLREIASGSGEGNDSKADATAASEALEVMGTRSPTSLRVTFEAVRRARRLSSLEAALEVEYRLALRMTADHDFAEGVRALLIDKDRNPRWSPATLADVRDADVEAVFAPLGQGEGPELRFDDASVH